MPRGANLLREIELSELELHPGPIGSGTRGLCLAPLASGAWETGSEVG